MIVVYDLETLASTFTYSDINIETQEINQFILHKDKFELIELIKYLKKCKAQIGFNNLGFDYPIIHYILLNYEIWINNPELGKIDVIKLIYDKAQQIINNQNNDETKFDNYIKEKDYKIIQLDLYKIWHYDNKARRTSLKALEISMNYPNVMECTIPFNKEDITLQEVDEILKYNLNDVLATYEFYKLSKDKISLRKSLSKQYGISCRNYSDSKLGESLILKLYCEKNKLNPYDIKKLRTYHKSIKLSECILPYIRFKSKEFTQLLEKFKSSIITKTKGAIEESVIYKGFKYVYGTGGIHGCCKAGIYTSNENYLIIDADVGLTMVQLKFH